MEYRRPSILIHPASEFTHSSLEDPIYRMPIMMWSRQFASMTLADLPWNQPQGQHSTTQEHPQAGHIYSEALPVQQLPQQNLAPVYPQSNPGTAERAETQSPPTPQSSASGLTLLTPSSSNAMGYAFTAPPLPPTSPPRPSHHSQRPRFSDDMTSEQMLASVQSQTATEDMLFRNRFAAPPGLARPPSSMPPPGSQRPSPGVPMQSYGAPMPSNGLYVQQNGHQIPTPNGHHVQGSYTSIHNVQGFAQTPYPVSQYQPPSAATNGYVSNGNNDNGDSSRKLNPAATEFSFR